MRRAARQDGKRRGTGAMHEKAAAGRLDTDEMPIQEENESGQVGRQQNYQQVSLGGAILWPDLTD